jgi:hypothetical protein
VRSRFIPRLKGKGVATDGNGVRASANPGGNTMTNPRTSHHIDLKDEDGHIAAAAEVSTESGPDGTVRASMYAKSEHVRRGDRTSLVDAVMDSAEVKASDRMEATVPYGDIESIERLRERTDDTELRAAGASTLVDANVPRDREQRTPESPAGDG